MIPKPQHANAHVVHTLSPSAGVKHERADWHEPHGVVQSVVHVGDKGVLYHARLGASGLQLLRNDIVVCIPLATLFSLAVEVNPDFAAAPNRTLSEAEAAEVAAQMPTT